MASHGERDLMPCTCRFRCRCSMLPSVKQHYTSNDLPSSRPGEPYIKVVLFTHASMIVELNKPVDSLMPQPFTSAQAIYVGNPLLQL